MAGTEGDRIIDAGQAESKANILLVDDREDKRLAMKTIIADLDQNVVQATSGREALRCLMQQDFAVILLDVNMPGMDGFETAHLIRQRKSLEHVPIIFVTGISDTENHVSRGYSLGAVDYILTPVVPEILRAKVSVFVQLFKVTEQVKRQAEHLRQAHDELETRVEQRTAELAIANESLQQEVVERQRVEEEIRTLNSELEKRVQERTVELVVANQELETFTYSIAHDLRAPLRQIHGYAQILQDEFASALPLDAQIYLKKIEERGRSMGSMVDDLLNLFGIAKENFYLHTTNLNLIVEDIISSIKPEHMNRIIQWNVGRLPTVECNPGLIRQAFTNLLSNAVKYTKFQSPAVIEIGQTRIKDEDVIYVKDNGVGFDMDYMDKLFGLFQRLHTAEEFEGSGIGLALVARIIRRHGGRIWAEGKVNKGATFYFTLGGSDATLTGNQKQLGK